MIRIRYEAPAYEAVLGIHAAAARRVERYWISGKMLEAPEARVSPSPVPVGTRIATTPHPRPHASPGLALSFGQRVLVTLRRWQHRLNPAQIDAHFGTSMSYRELLVQTVHAAEGFKALGLEPRDVVALVSKNCHEMVPAALGAVCAGLTVACTAASDTPDEMRHALTLVQPKAVISERDCVREARAAYPDARHIVLSGEPPEGVETFLDVMRMGETAEPRPDPDTYRAADVGDRTQHAPFILYSSGTTGLPKAVMLRDTSLTAFLRNYPVERDDVDKVTDPKLLASSPFCWISGMWQTLLSLEIGITRVFTTVRDEFSIMSAIDKYKIHTWCTQPSPLLSLVSLHKSRYENRYDLSSLRCLQLGGVSLGSTTHDAFRRRLGCEVSVSYACTESGNILVCPKPGECPSPPGTMGRLLPGVELRLVNVDTGEDIPADVKNAVGEVRVRSEYLMLGYYNNPEETEKAFDEYGFYRTGDLAYEGDDGFFFFVDRMKELIKYKGLQISPAEVERVLMQHPGVRETCVIGRPVRSDEIGEVPTAFVSRKDNTAGEALTEAELQDMVIERLSDYKRLRGGVIFLDQLPRTVSGKVARCSLRQMLMRLT